MKTIVIYCQDLSDIKELIFKILQRYSNKIIYAVPHISRRPVNNEIHGVHGHFITNDVRNQQLFLFHI